MSWWERERAKGQASYARETALRWGGCMVVFTTLYDYFVGHKFSFLKLVIAIPLYYAGGYILGLWNWKGNERHYQKMLDDGDAPPGQAG